MRRGRGFFSTFCVKDRITTTAPAYGNLYHFDVIFDVGGDTTGESIMQG